MSMNGTSREERITRVRMARESKKEARLERVAENKAFRASRTDQEQLKRLDKLLGKGCGATRERAKLLKRIESK